MGLCIHYRGRLKSLDLIRPLTDELVDIAQSLGWEAQRLDGDLGRENTARLVHAKRGAEITGYLPLPQENRRTIAHSIRSREKAPY